MADPSTGEDRGIDSGASTHGLNGKGGLRSVAGMPTDWAAVSPTEDSAASGIRASVPRVNGSAQDLQSGMLPAEAQPPTGGAEASLSAGPREIKVADIRKSQQDCRGEKIDFVFFRRRNFAIYRSGGRIMVHFSDDEAVARQQIADTAELLPLRDRLQYLVSDLAAPHGYQWQIAESLRLGLDGQKDAAKRTMLAAIDDIIAMRMSRGRTEYLLYAGLAAALVVICAGAAALWFVLNPSGPDVASARVGLGHLLMATGSGAMGALLSTAIALRVRTVATDGDFKSNVVDSAIRILIGVISAAVLYLILDSRLLAGVKLATNIVDDDMIWKIALLAGFVAGFLERLVPDLLENKLAPASKPVPA
jgi:hypothetical protein